MKTARTYRRNSSNNNDEDDKHGKSRQQLPRRCKSIQPFYAIDMANEEDDHIIPTNKRKRGNGSSSSMTKKALVQQPRQKKLPVEANPVTVTVTVTVTEKEAENKELMTSAITVLSWLIDMKVLRENSLLYCIKELNEKPIGRGLVTRQGVACCCCEKIIPLLKFPHHRGVLTDRPYEKIFVVDAGVSLLTCIIEAWNRHSVPARSGYHHVEKRVNVNDDYDDCCAICADGGELICCENCPSTYHPDCGVPKDDWHCPYSHCKACVADNPVRRMDLDIDGVNTEKLYLKAKCNTMVVLAAKVMEESFKLIVDRQTRANMVESVVYNCGSNFTRTNFSRFYTAILEFEGQVVSVASFRYSCFNQILCNQYSFHSH
ncbi:Increased DNA methylation 1 [Bienertia sinuspersici]